MYLFQQTIKLTVRPICNALYTMYLYVCFVTVYLAQQASLQLGRFAMLQTPVFTQTSNDSIHLYLQVGL